VRSTLARVALSDAVQALAALDDAVDQLADLAAAEAMNPEGASVELRAEREGQVADCVRRARELLAVSASGES
jgi:hypothetical protein